MADGTLRPSQDPWRGLARFTQARIGLGRIGASQTTAATLDFNTAHAHARDAVHASLDVNTLRARFEQAGFRVEAVRSRAGSRQRYLQLPPLGSRLDEQSAARLQQRCHTSTSRRLALVVADGLSSSAAEHHALPVAVALRALLPDWELDLVVVAEQARVALGDEIGELCAAAASVVLIGERPGLQSADSLGAYITFAPRVGRTNAERNCVSNIHAQGLPHAVAAKKIAGLLRGALLLGATGIALKDTAAQDDPLARQIES